MIFSKSPDFLEILDDSLIRYLAYFNYKDYVERINLDGRKKVLEVGSGGGNLSRFISKKLTQGELVCLDISDYWISKAKRRLRNFQNIRFELTDFLDFNKEDSFDIAVIHYVLHDVPHERRKDFMNILDKTLKEEKGRIYIREPTRKSHGIAPHEIKSLMIEKGFLEQESIEGYSFPLKKSVYEGIFQKVFGANKKV